MELLDDGRGVPGYVKTGDGVLSNVTAVRASQFEKSFNFRAVPVKAGAKVGDSALVRTVRNVVPGYSVASRVRTGGSGSDQKTIRLHSCVYVQDNSGRADVVLEEIVTLFSRRSFYCSRLTFKSDLQGIHVLACLRVSLCFWPDHNCVQRCST